MAVLYGVPGDAQTEASSHEPRLPDAGPASCGSSAHRRKPRAVISMIEGDIIPRLVLAHQRHVPPGPEPNRGRPAAIDPEDVARFVPLILQEEMPVLVALVEGYLAQGIAVQSLFVDLIAPAARQLGVMWENDSCDFVDVTMALWRLQELVYALSARVPLSFGGRQPRGVAMFTPVPGDQHTLGAIMVEESFRHAGWETLETRGIDEAELLAIARARHIDLIGLTLSIDLHIERTKRLIAAVRKASRNKAMAVMVGGRVVNERPDIVAYVGADGTAATAAAAVVRAEQLVNAFAFANSRAAHA